MTSKEKKIQNLIPHQVKPGQVLNPTGKNKGTLNRITIATRELLAEAAQQNLPAVNKAIDDLLRSDNEIIRSRGVELYLRMLEFSQPRLQAVAVKGEISTGIVVIGKPDDLNVPFEDISDNDHFIDNTDECK